MCDTCLCDCDEWWSRSICAQSQARDGRVGGSNGGAASIFIKSLQYYYYYQPRATRSKWHAMLS